MEVDSFLPLLLSTPVLVASFLLILIGYIWYRSVKPVHQLSSCIHLIFLAVTALYTCVVSLQRSLITVHGLGSTTRTPH